MTTTDDTRRRRELRAFLIARRAAVAPQSAGVASSRRRRTPGLRREELATLASVGVTWYTWLEQGRDIRPSTETLHRIASALRLTPTDTAYLFSLADVPRAETLKTEGPIALDGSIQRVLDTFRAPAFVLGPCWDVEAFNELADRVFQFSKQSGPFARNHLWRLFMDPTRRARYLDWHVLAETAVGLLRAAYPGRVGHPGFNRLVAALSENSAEFGRLWSSQKTAPLAPAPTRLSVPGFGALDVTLTDLRVPGADDCLLVLLPPADERSARLMARIARDPKPSGEGSPRTQRSRRGSQRSGR